jgi:2-polyprenyl-6-methoxyphenol hydroxylase-like FAD-dependent oxidoreductase
MKLDPTTQPISAPANEGQDRERSTYDVAIVGYGPVGQLLATLMARQGHSVVVLERHSQIYPMPRAVHFDHEVARILQSVGIRPDESDIIEPYDNWYEWRNAARETLLKVDWRGVGPSWWHTSNFFAQPDLEHELDLRARREPLVEVRRSCTVTGLAQDGDGVTLRVDDATAPADAPSSTLRARYVVGCDGANSTVRRLLDMPVNDLGYFFDWLIVDMIPNEPVVFDPPAWQLCDPKRPTTIVPGGPGRRRWEFMALPGEDIGELNKAATAWRLLQPWGMTPDTATMERHTVYQFQAQWARQWRAGRVLIAGDAAHLMPPFAGQGMCAGLRDVFNLQWKLDLVLRGWNDALLDTYGSEREPHAKYFIDLSIELGRVICVPDEADAAERDRQMKAALTDPAIEPPVPDPPRLGPGVLSARDKNAGLLSMQGRVETNGTQGLFDDLLGYGWLIITTQTAAELARAVPAEDLALLEGLGARTVTIGSTAEADVRDTDGRYSEWFQQLGADVVIIRPDFYIFSATVVTELNGALRALREGIDPIPTAVR